MERSNNKVREWLEKCIEGVISDKFAMNNDSGNLIFCSNLV